MLSTRNRLAFGAILSLWLLAPATAQAYLDAGTGSMILQIVLATVTGAILLAKTYWQRIKSFFGARSEPSQVDAAESAAPGNEPR